MAITKRTRNYIIAITAVIVVIATAFILPVVLDNRLEQAEKEEKEKAAQISRIDSLERANVILDSLKESYKNTVYKQNDSLEAKDTTIAKSNRANDSIKALLDKCKGVKKKPAAKKPVPIQKTTPAVTKQTVSADLVSPNAFKPSTEGFKSTSTYKTSIDGIKVVGLKDGDFYITISPDNYLQYCFAKKLYDEAGGTGTPELNGKNSGKKFALEGDMYVYTDKSTQVTTATLSRTINWTVYIGPKDGYDAYIPHELIKPQISQARGDLAGTISQEDVDKIGAFVPEVKAGRILPNKITAIGDYDGLKYEGWHFRTSILYKQQ